MKDVLAAVLIQGLLVGGRLALFASGFTILLGGLRMPFVAYGQIILLGSYGVWSVENALHVDFLIAAALTVLILLPTAVLMERLLFRRHYLNADPLNAYLILTIGLTQILSNALELTFTVDPYTLFTEYLHWRTSFFGVRTSAAVLIALAITYSSLLTTALLIRFSRFGRALRAIVQNREAAMLMGVDVVGLSRHAYILAIALAVVGGTVYALVSSFGPELASELAGLLFVIVLVGGAGSIFGAMVVGLIFGFVQAGAPIIMPPYLADLLLYVLLFVVLLARPEGLFSR